MRPPIILISAKYHIHLICRWKGESLRESIKRHEHFLALQLGLKPGQKVLFSSQSIIIYLTDGVIDTNCWVLVSNCNFALFSKGVGCRVWNWWTIERNCSIQVTYSYWWLMMKLLLFLSSSSNDVSSYGVSLICIN